MSLRDIEVSFERVRVLPAIGESCFFVGLSFPDGKSVRIGWQGSMKPDAEEFFRDISLKAIEARDMSVTEYAEKYGLSQYRARERHGYCRILLDKVRSVFADEDRLAEMVEADFGLKGPAL